MLTKTKRPASSYVLSIKPRSVDPPQPLGKFTELLCHTEGQNTSIIPYGGTAGEIDKHWKHYATKLKKGNCLFWSKQINTNQHVALDFRTILSSSITQLVSKVFDWEMAWCESSSRLDWTGLDWTVLMEAVAAAAAQPSVCSASYL